MTPRRNNGAAAAALFGALALLGACASRPAGHAGPTAAKVPPITLNIPSDPYPTEAKHQKITGRVLVEFHIDAHGKAVSARVIEAEAPAQLQAAALEVLSRASFDVSAPSYDASGATAYRYAFRFCILGCGALAPYPGYEEIVLTGDSAR